MTLTKENKKKKNSQRTNNLEISLLISVRTFVQVGRCAGTLISQMSLEAVLEKLLGELSE